MKLSIKDIENISSGACQVFEDTDGVHLLRFTKEEEEYYKTTVFKDKLYSSAGIALSFVTSSPTLSLKINALPSATRSYFSVDIFEDGEKIGDIKNFTDDVKTTLYPARKVFFRRCETPPQ